MNAAILTIGDEILNGSTIDTNSAFLGKICAENGIAITSILSVTDTKEGIINGLQSIAPSADIIITTGGLGPTNDDITKEVLASFFDVPLIYNKAQEENILRYFRQRGRKEIPIPEKQASAPKDCTLLANNRGTAMGIWMEYQDKIFISMPGVPHEMKNIFEYEALPKIKANYKLPTIINRYIMTAAIGETRIAEMINDIVETMPSYISIAYLPSLGSVKVRLTAISKSQVEKEVIHFQQKIASRIEKYVFSSNPTETIAQAVGDILKSKHKTLATAESCTGGKIAHKITAIAGSSGYYEGSIIAYSYDIKKSHLGVKESTLEKHGAVSEETVIEMANGLLKKMKTDYAIAVSGIAGPGGGMPNKPVGTVWIAVGDNDKIIAKKHHLTPHRDNNIEISSVFALEMLRQFLNENM
ncbi:MAG: CinA family nicotinamide mononucleotide deamidase-related protein [Chitinophagales bacterium]